MHLIGNESVAKFVKKLTIYIAFGGNKKLYLLIFLVNDRNCSPNF